LHADDGGSRFVLAVLQGRKRVRLLNPESVEACFGKGEERGKGGRVTGGRVQRLDGHDANRGDEDEDEDPRDESAEKEGEKEEDGSGSEGGWSIPHYSPLSFSSTPPPWSSNPMLGMSYVSS
jgi:hypothetical protein